MSEPAFQPPSRRPRLLLVTGSTRPGRAGPAVAGWFAGLARRDARFDLVEADLGLLNLPLLDEPEHASEHRYVHGHTRRWSELVASADALVLVTPEYNRSFPAPLKNALDYLYDEWRDKPVGFVGYGMTSMGLRAVEALVPVVTALKMIPIAEAVCVPLRAALAEDGSLRPTPAMTPAAASLLDELHRLATLLAVRTGVAA
jgi:NAD(P)H-dependent FMN reductase